MKVSLKVILPLLLVPVIIFSFFAFRGPEESDGLVAKEVPSFVPAANFNDYWYEGKGELNGYTLEQARYGEMHKGEAVLVFVAEDFSTKDHTKSTGPGVPVLKVNFDKKFITGIYPYSMMMTVASPIDINRYPHPLTVATSSQEWCGHTFTQLNLKGKSYDFTEHSYFPGEGDQEKTIPVTMLEDEVWTRLRIAPDKMPIGKVEMIPATFYMRLRHLPQKAFTATTKMVDGEKGERIYQIVYVDGSRDLNIRFEKDFPHRILGWEETYQSGYGRSNKRLTTKATLNNTMKLDYWNRNKNSDRVYRQRLGLEENCL